MCPPPAKNAAMTAAHSSISCGSSPTLNVIQLPSPTIGMASPVDGMGRVSGGASAACAAGTKVAAMEACRKVRRVVGIRSSSLGVTHPTA